MFDKQSDGQREAIGDADNTVLLLHNAAGQSGEPDKSIPRLLGLACIFAGIQFGWALQIAYTTQVFESLGVGKEWLSYIWLAGPVSGFVVQPIAGSMSDRCEAKMGRRRPFMIVGTVLIVLGLLLISNAELIGRSLGAVMGLSAAGCNTFAIVLGVVGFWILDMANNAVQGPCRALIADKAPNQQPLANSILAICLSLGNVSGYLMGWKADALLHYVPFMKTPTRLLFTISCIFLIITCVVTSLVANEKKHRLTPAQLAVNRPFLDLPRALYSAMKNMSTAMVRVCIVQFFTWVAYFTFLIYMQSWMTANVFGGFEKGTQEQQKLYQEGTAAGSLGLTFQSIATFLCSFVLPWLLKKTSVRIVYGVGLLLLAGNLASTYWIRGIENKNLAIATVGMNGIPWSVVITVPFTLVAEASSKASVGVSIGVMNVFIVLPQFLVSLSAGPLVKYTNDASTAMLAGSAFAVFAAIATIFLVKPEKSLYDEEDGEDEFGAVFAGGH